MPLTPEQQENCYGCQIAEFEASVNESLSFKWGEGNWADVALSQLSDAQEMALRGRVEQARHVMNRAKWIIARKLIDPKAKVRA